eukprot:gene1328-1450_t
MEKEREQPHKRARVGSPVEVEEDFPYSSDLLKTHSAVWGRLHAYQKKGVSFIMERLGDVHTSSSSACLCAPHSGAILADDMGTGKTATALIAVTTLTKILGCKGVIVTPLTLVENWLMEMNKWLPPSLSSSIIAIRSSSGVSSLSLDRDVNRFITSHASVHPLLVLSYDMFRCYAEALNTMTNLEILVCDEGHRIKDSLETKTVLALGNSCALRRLVITGTLFQNNLDELFSVVHFAAPGYLGTLKQFRQKFSVPIEKGRAASAPKTTLAKALGARAELNALLSVLVLRRTKQAVLTATLPPCSRWLVGVVMTPSEQQEYSALVDLASRSGSSKDNDNPLSIIQQLRQWCSGGSEGESMTAKLKICEQLIDSIAATISSEQHMKVIIASNFTATLDAVWRLVKRKRLGSLRIDGSVAADKRMKIVNLFNKEPGFPLLLMSTHVGGVGLNLTAADRLIILDPDWNPSTDEQVMARIWRQGQTRPTHVYRLYLIRTVEESILSRQKDKTQLQTLLNNNDNCSTEFDFDNCREDLGFKSSPDSLQTLLIPQSNRTYEDQRSEVNERVLSLVLDVDPSITIYKDDTLIL